MPFKSSQNELGARILSILWLALLVATSYLLLISGKEFLYDDAYFLRLNPDFLTVHHFRDCFHFQLQATKPLFNFIIALGYLWGHGQVVTQRLISVFFHVLCVEFFFLNLVCLRDRIEIELPRGFCVIAASLFAILPIHTEILGIGQFRGDLQGAFFCLVAIYLIQKLATNRRGPVISFLLLVGVVAFLWCAQLSKEIYAGLLPVFLMFFFLIGKDGRLNFDGPVSWVPLTVIITISQIGYALLLRHLLALDATSMYSYNSTIGVGIMSHTDQIRVAGRTFLEVLWKTLSGNGLTTTRLTSRVGLGAAWPWPVHLAILIAGAFAWLISWWLAGWWRVAGIFFFLSTSLYLGIPNVNAGSEHYTYFSSLGLVIFIVLFVAAFYQRITSEERIFWLILATYAVILLSQLELRELDMYTRLAFIASDLKSHPESPEPWVDMGIEKLNRSEGTKEELLSYARKAEALVPEFATAISFEEAVYVAFNDWDDYVNNLPRILNSSLENRRKSLLLQDYAIFSAARGYCEELAYSLALAKELDPKSPVSGQLAKQFQELIAAKRVVCTEAPPPHLLDFVRGRDTRVCSYPSRTPASEEKNTNVFRTEMQQNKK